MAECTVKMSIAIGITPSGISLERRLLSRVDVCRFLASI